MMLEVLAQTLWSVLSSCFSSGSLEFCRVLGREYPSSKNPGRRVRGRPCRQRFTLAGGLKPSCAALEEESHALAHLRLVSPGLLPPALPLAAPAGLLPLE